MLNIHLLLCSCLRSLFLSALSSAPPAAAVQVDKKTKQGFTPLEIAALNGRTEVVDSLIRVGQPAASTPTTRPISANAPTSRPISANAPPPSPGQTFQASVHVGCPLMNAVEGGHLDTGGCYGPRPALAAVEPCSQD